jgi:uncharacterized protein (TIGR03437 family)
VNGVPLKRSDFTYVRFAVNDAMQPGLRNSVSRPIITADSEPSKALQSAINSWNSHTSSALRFGPLETTTAANDSSDRRNVFVLRDTPAIRSVVGTALAITIRADNVNPELSDTDILFNPNLVRQSTVTAFATTGQADAYDLQTVATHELGHALGANHSSVAASVMFPRIDVGSTISSHLTSDDLAFLRAVYPAAGAASFGSISGTITRGPNDPVTGVLVTAHEPRLGHVISVLSSLQNGSYQVSPLPPGEYFLTAEAADGPVHGFEFTTLPVGSINTKIRPRIFGNVNAPTPIQVTASRPATADFRVDETPKVLDIEWLGKGPPESPGKFTALDRRAVVLDPGQAVDLLLAGPGLDAALSVDDIGILVPGVSARPNSLVIDSMPNPSGLPLVRVTVDVADRTERQIGSITVRKATAFAVHSGGVVVEGTPPPPRPVFSAAGIVSAASFQGAAVAPGQIVSIFGSGLATETAQATTQPLPTNLGGTTAEVTDALGFVRPMSLIFVLSGVQGQINGIMPANAALGPATITIRNGAGQSATAQLSIAATAPGIFTANSTGAGVPAATGLRVAGDGARSAVTVFDGTVSPRTPVPIDLGPEGDQVFLSLFGTGIRGFRNSVQVSIGGQNAPVAGVAPQGQFAGLDQINVRLPRTLIGRGPVFVEVRVDGQPANAVSIAVK